LTGVRLLAAAVLVVAIVAGGRAWLGGDTIPDSEVFVVDKGDYSDIVEIRGQVQPEKTTYVTAPYNAGELQILKLSPNGTQVRAGDVVAEFDAVTLRRTIQEKQSELRSANAELQQGDAQSKIAVEEKQAAVATARFDVVKAKLSLGEIGLVSEIDAARAKLALADAETRLREAEAALASAKATAETERHTRLRRIEKVQAELARAQAQVEALHVRAPVDGIVSIQPNYRSPSFGSMPPEYRAGDRAYPGAPILELPDLSSVFLTARIDEADRGRLEVGQTAVIRVDAVADRDYQAKVIDISLLARTDFMSGWPPPKQFDLTMAITDPDERLRPGMSAGARITVGRLPDVLLLPSSAIFFEAGRTVVFKAGRRGFEPVPIEILRRGRDQAAVSGSLAEGDRVARSRPGDLPAEATP
jgi:multidrug efflux pump subunit AcrA (membrane-fusion protein)